jgi:hypothetical protein
MHRTTEQFRKRFKLLPQHIQQLSRREFLLLKENPRHPSLHFKKLGTFWSIRIGLYYRALAIEDDSDYLWVWIGTHDEYDRMIAKQD